MFFWKFLIIFVLQNTLANETTLESQVAVTQKQYPTAQEVHKWVSIEATSINIKWSDRFSLAINKAVTGYSISTWKRDLAKPTLTTTLYGDNYLQHTITPLDSNSSYHGVLDSLIGKHKWSYNLLNFTVETPRMLNGKEASVVGNSIRKSEISDLESVSCGIRISWLQSPFIIENKTPTLYILKIWNDNDVIRERKLVTPKSTFQEKILNQHHSVQMEGLSLDQLFKVTLEGRVNKEVPGLTLSFNLQSGSIFADEGIKTTGGVEGCFSALQVRCPNSDRCVSPYWICDGSKDCPDGADEENCEENLCQDGFSCWGQTKCLPSSWRCDGMQDCLDGEDELGCGNCDGKELLRCGTGSDCISNGFVCDGHPHCPDGWDESAAVCNFTTSSVDEMKHSCHKDSFVCPLDFLCIPFTSLCDRKIDCIHGEDENNNLCNFESYPDVTSNLPNSSTEKRIVTGKSLDSGQNVQDAPSVSKVARETSAVNFISPLATTTVNPTNTDTTVAKTMFEESFDKSNVCRGDEFDCGDGWCVPLFWLCDGRFDCLNGEDEDLKVCSPVLNEIDTTHNEILTVDHICFNGEFKCNNGMCITQNNLCNGITDCPSAEDENDCHYMTKSSDLMGTIYNSPSNSLPTSNYKITIIETDPDVKLSHKITTTEDPSIENGIPKTLTENATNISSDHSLHLTINKNQENEISLTNNDYDSTNYTIAVTSYTPTALYSYVNNNVNTSSLNNSEYMSEFDAQNEIALNIDHNPDEISNTIPIFTTTGYPNVKEIENLKHSENENTSISKTLSDSIKKEINGYHNDFTTTITENDKYYKNDDSLMINDSDISNFENQNTLNINVTDQKLVLNGTEVKNFSSNGTLNIELENMDFSSLDYLSLLQLQNEIDRQVAEFEASLSITNLTSQYDSGVDNTVMINSDTVIDNENSSSIGILGTYLDENNVTTKFLNESMQLITTNSSTINAETAEETSNVCVNIPNIETNNTVDANNNLTVLVSGTTSSDGFLILTTNSPSTETSVNSTVLIAIQGFHPNDSLPNYVVHDLDGRQYEYDVVHVTDKLLKGKSTITPPNQSDSPYLLEKVVTFRLETNGNFKLQESEYPKHKSIKESDIIRIKSIPKNCSKLETKKHSVGQTNDSTAAEDNENNIDTNKPKTNQSQSFDNWGDYVIEEVNVDQDSFDRKTELNNFREIGLKESVNRLESNNLSKRNKIKSIHSSKTLEEYASSEKQLHRDPEADPIGEQISIKEKKATLKPKSVHSLAPENDHLLKKQPLPTNKAFDEDIDNDLLSSILRMKSNDDIENNIITNIFDPSVTNEIDPFENFGDSNMIEPLSLESIDRNYLQKIESSSANVITFSIEFISLSILILAIIIK